MIEAEQLIDKLISEGRISTAAVKSALSDVAHLDDVTPYSMWYKNDHEKGRNALLKVLRELVKSLKSSSDPDDKQNFVAVKKYLDGVVSYSNGTIPKFLK